MVSHPQADSLDSMAPVTVFIYWVWNFYFSPLAGHGLHEQIYHNTHTTHTHIACGTRYTAHAVHVQLKRTHCSWWRVKRQRKLYIRFTEMYSRNRWNCTCKIAAVNSSNELQLAEKEREKKIFYLCEDWSVGLNHLQLVCISQKHLLIWWLLCYTFQCQHTTCSSSGWELNTHLPSRAIY